MIALQIAVNGEVLATVGADNASFGCGIHLESWPEAEELGCHPTLNVAGLQDFTWLKWPAADGRTLAVGDEVVIRLVDVQEPDVPVRSRQKDADAAEAQERLNYERLKRKYEQT